MSELFPSELTSISAVDPVFLFDSSFLERIESIKNSLESKDLKEISKLQIRMNRDMDEIADLYKRYSDNQI